MEAEIAVKWATVRALGARIPYGYSPKSSFAEAKIAVKVDHEKHCRIEASLYSF